MKSTPIILKNVLMVGLVLLGTLRFWGDLFDLKKLQLVTFGLGFSPLPIVFSNRDGIEDFANDTTLTFKSIKGPLSVLKFDKKAYEKLPYHSELRAVYSIALLYSTRFPETLWRPPLMYGLCDSKELAQAFGQEALEAVTVDITHRAGTIQNWKHEILCSN